MDETKRKEWYTPYDWLDAAMFVLFVCNPLFGLAEQKRRKSFRSFRSHSFSWLAERKWRNICIFIFPAWKGVGNQNVGASPSLYIHHVIPPGFEIQGIILSTVWNTFMTRVEWRSRWMYCFEELVDFTCMPCRGHNEVSFHSVHVSNLPVNNAKLRKLVIVFMW